MRTATQQAPELNLQVTRERLFEQVVQQLEAVIIDGGLQPGDRLPSERQLADSLGVSRTVIREAAKSLEQKGLLRVLTGSGTYVTQVDPQTVSQSIGLLFRQTDLPIVHLSEVRRILEIEIAGLAAERATGTDLAAMEEALAGMDKAVADLEVKENSLEKFVAADLAFHNAMAQACHNPLVPLLLEPISELLLEIRRLASSAEGAPKDALGYHRRIIESVKAQHPARCRELMREHLTKAERWAAQAGQQD